jgi:hypothetical protein
MTPGSQLGHQDSAVRLWCGPISGPKGVSFRSGPKLIRYFGVHLINLAPGTFQLTDFVTSAGRFNATGRVHYAQLYSRVQLCGTASRGKSAVQISGLCAGWMGRISGRTCGYTAFMDSINIATASCPAQAGVRTFQALSEGGSSENKVAQACAVPVRHPAGR